MHLQLDKATTATLLNANADKKERHGDEHVNTVDLKLSIDYKPEHFGQLFTKPDAVQAALFDKDEVLEHQMKPISFESTTLKDQIFTIKGTGYDKMKFSPATSTVMFAEPRNGPIMELTFSVRVYPSVEEIGPLCDMVHEHVKITIVDNQTRTDEEKE